MSKLLQFAVCQLVVLGVFFIPTVKASAPETSLFEQNAYLETFSPVEAIEYYSDVFNSPKKELLNVSFCESSYNTNAKGDQGKAIGIFQYHKETFFRYAKLMGEELDYYSSNDQAKLTAFIFAHYPQEKKAWSCYTSQYGK